MSNFIKNVTSGYVGGGFATLLQMLVQNGVTTRQGSIIVVVAYGNTSGISVSSVTDTQGNTYVPTYQQNYSNRSLEHWVCQDPVALTALSDSIQVNLTGGAPDHGINAIADLYRRIKPAHVAYSDNLISPGSENAPISYSPVWSSDQLLVSSVAFNGNEASISLSGNFTGATTNAQTGTTVISLATAYYSVSGSSPSTVNANWSAPTAHTAVTSIVSYLMDTVDLTTPNLALAAPLLTPSGPPQSVTLTTPNIALAAPLVSIQVGHTVQLTTPNITFAAPLVTPVGNAAVVLTTPNLQLGAPLLHLPATGTPPGIGISHNFGGYPSPATPASPVAGNGYEVQVRGAPDYKTLLAIVPAYQTLTFAAILNDKGSGTITIPLNDGDYQAFWAQTLGNGYLANDSTYGLLAQEHLWQVYHDNILVFEFLAETVTEQQVDNSEQRIATITGPGTAQCLSWAMAAPPGFPNIVFKTDAIQDGFSEIDINGNLALDTDIWNLVTPAADVSLNPSGTLQIVATPTGTFCGATPYDITNSSISAQMAAMNGTTLDGSQLTQMYVQDINNSGNYALIGVNGTAFYCQIGDTVANKVVTKQLGTYDPNNDLYWRISESAVDPQNDPGGPRAFVFWTSADGATWAAVFIVTYQWLADYIDFFFAATYDQVNTASIQIQNVNAEVVTPTSQGSTYFGEPIMAVWMANLLAAQKRGTIPFITTGRLSATTDSFGNPWTDSNSVQIQNGTDLYSLLQGHTAIVNADYFMAPGFKLLVGMPAPTQTATYDTVIAEDFPFIWWSMNDAAGAGAADSSGHDFGGTPTGVAFGLPNGFDGETCAGFNGQTSMVASDLSPTTLPGVSAEAWVNLQPEISYRTTPATYQFTTPAATQVVPKQTGTQPGDWIFIYVFNGGGGLMGTLSCPGFTAVQDASSYGGLLYRLADGTEGSTFTVAGLNVLTTAGAVIATLAGAANTLDVVGTPNAASAATSLGVSSITLTKNDDWLLWFAGMESNAINGNGYGITAPAGMTTQATSGTQNSSPSMILADNEAPTAGATGTKTGTTPTSGRWSGVMVALTPGHTLASVQAIVGSDAAPNTSSKGFRLSLFNSIPAWACGNGSSNSQAIAPSGLPTGWNHLVGTWDGTTQCIYLNGSLATTALLSGTLAPSGDITAGAQPGGGNHYFGGLLEDVAVYNYALSAGQVMAHYNARTSSTWVPLRLGTDRSQQIVFREGLDTATKQRTRARDQIANLIGAVNSDGITVTSEDFVSIGQWGQREGWVQSATQVTPASMAIVVDASLGQTKDEVDSRTLTILPRQANKTPFEHFNVGDWIGLERQYSESSWSDQYTDVYYDTYGQESFNGVDVVRVVGISIGIAQDGMDTCELTINTYRQWLQQQMLYLVNKLGGQFINSLGTTPVTSFASSVFGVPITVAPQLSSLGDVVQGTVHEDVLTWNAVLSRWQPSSLGYVNALSAPEMVGSVTWPLSKTVYTVTIEDVTDVGLSGGSTVIVVTGSSAADVPTSVTDNGGNTYTLQESLSTEYMQVWSSVGSTALSNGKQLTVTYPSPAAGVINIAVLECEGADPYNSLDPALIQAATGTGTAIAVSGTAALTGEMVLGFIQNDASGGAPAAPAGWTKLTEIQSGTGSYLWIGYILPTSVTAGQAISLTSAITSANWAAGILGVFGVNSTLGHTVTAPDGTRVQLDTSSGTALMRVFDPSGNLRSTLGPQADGSITHTDSNAPAPLAPSAPVVQAGVLSLYAGWGGFMFDGSQPLSDLLYVEVHYSTNSGFTPDSSTLVGHVFPGGFWSIGNLSNAVTYYVKLVAINTSGVASAASAQTAATPGAAVEGGEFLCYNPSPGAGNLVASMTGAATVDTFGNTVNAGIWTYGNVGFANVDAVGVTTTVQNGSFLVNIAGFTANASVAANQQGVTFAAPWIQMLAPTQSGSNGQGALTVLSGNTGATTSAMVLIAVGSSTTPITNNLLEVQGNIALANGTSNVALAQTARGNVTATGSVDTNVYHLGASTVWLTSTQTSTSTMANITGLSIAVKATTYKIRGVISAQQGSNAIGQKFQFAGPGTSLVMLNTKVIQIPSGGSSTSELVYPYIATALATLQTTNAYGANDTFSIEFEGMITFSATGSFSVQFQNGSGSDTWTALAGSFIELSPMA